MQTLETKKTLSYLNSQANAALRQLRNELAFDFCADLTAFRLSGKFTAKKIVSAALEHGIFCPSSYKFAVVFRSASAPAYKSGFYGTVLDAYREQFTFPRFYAYTNCDRTDWTQTLVYFWAKKDFEAMRKREDCEVIVIAQERDLLRGKKSYRGFNPDERYKVLTVNKGYIDHGRTECVSNVLLRESHAGGWESTYPGNYTPQLSDIIDKSGYLIGECRNALMHRLNERRKAARKNAYLKIDHSAKIDALKERLFSLKDRIAADFSAATTYEELRRVLTVTTSFYGLERAMQNYEDLCRTEANREYPSEDAFCIAYRNIEAILDTVEERMKRVA